MLLVLWAVLFTAAAMLAWDWWTHRPRTDDRRPYDWQTDPRLARILHDQQAATDAWDRYFDQHAVLVIPTAWKETA